jgi:hypothetical protein
MAFNHQPDTAQEREPQRDDSVRIGPVNLPNHEWIGNFVRWEDAHRRFFLVDVDEGKRVRVRAECLRGLV